MASIGPFSICCFMAQYSMKRGSPAHSWRTGRGEGMKGRRGDFFFKRRKEEKEESQVYYYSLILKTHQGDLSQSPSFPMNKLAAALIWLVTLRVERQTLMRSIRGSRKKGRKEGRKKQRGWCTLRNRWRRKVNQFVSIFSATDSVLNTYIQVGGH